MKRSAEALAQNDEAVKADGKRWDFSWRLKVDSLWIERMCRGPIFYMVNSGTKFEVL